MIDHVESATPTEKKNANINFSSFFTKSPNKIPANISGYMVVLCHMNSYIGHTSA